MEAAQQKPAEPAAPAVAVVESEKKVQREKTKEKPAIKGTHHTTSSVLVCRVCGDGLSSSFNSCGAAHTRVCRRHAFDRRVRDTQGNQVPGEAGTARGQVQQVLPAHRR